MTGRHRMPRLERMPLPFVPLLVVGAPLAVVWAAAGLWMAVRSLC